jgi:hypothetical protein
VSKGDFAILRGSGKPTLGVNAEDLPVDTEEVESAGKTRVVSVSTGATARAVDARARRDAVMVLLRGTTPLKGRILGAYSRTDLRYRGSLALPCEALHMAMRRDTLVVVGEDDEDPVVAALIIQRRR